MMFSKKNIITPFDNFIFEIVKPENQTKSI